MDKQRRSVMICQHSACKIEGAAKVFLAFHLANLPPDVVIMSTGCQGQCSSGPTVRILPEETWYCRVKPQDVTLIVEQHLRGGQPVKEKLHPRIHLYG
ncbi:2Fe-2S ferredoxin [Rippkaea orientalis PCC 8801]|uniref:2Fe-2S ferredoxin n=1 Tax=Rippkaea orientalis (strain PCC 8801 / RF-1) TaxID=41431 RepID=B7K2N8_RIPO1|nr:(2Fe-2S) ferredoxin domain-containing protein [Rippkaea orientalis]ACK66431.1 2Fe-2S ferredoxin [Rippkaea orientalis PCC 8801]